MRKRQELTRGARFSNARAKALRAAKAAMKKDGVDESTAAKVLKGFGQMVAAPKETPASKASTPKGNGNKSTTRTGSPGSTKASKKAPKATTRSNTRTGARGKKSRDTRLFKGKFTSRGNRR